MTSPLLGDSSPAGHDWLRLGSTSPVCSGSLPSTITVIIGATAELDATSSSRGYTPACAAPASKAGTSGGLPSSSMRGRHPAGEQQRGQSLGQLARSYRVFRTTIHRLLREHAATDMEKSV